MPLVSPLVGSDTFFMSKDPAFLFYTNDFLSGIQDLTFDERGQFITLLCLQHQKGHLSDKLIKLSIGNAAADVMAKFRQDSAGLWYNVRLESEIEKRQAHGEKQRKRAIEGWEKRKKDTKHKPNESLGIAVAMPLEDVNEDVNEIENNLNRALDEIYLDQQKPKWPHIDFDFEVNSFKEKVRGSPEHYRNHDSSGLRLAFQSQLRNAKKKFNGTSTKQQQSAGTAEYLKQYYSDKLAGK